MFFCAMTTGNKKGTRLTDRYTTTMTHFLEPKTGVLTGNETALDILLGGRVGHDIQCVITAFLDKEPDFPDEQVVVGYIDNWDSLGNHEGFPVEMEEFGCYNQLYDDDFVL